MKPELEVLLKAFGAFAQAPECDAQRFYAMYEAALQQVATVVGIPVETLDKLVRLKHPRWVRANLPPRFPKELGLE